MEIAIAEALAEIRKSYCTARILSLPVLLLVWASSQAASHCVILQYHHFSDQTPAITSVSPEQFDDHLAYLSTHQFNVLPLRQVVAALRQNTTLPDRCVSLTVDDAYLSVYTNAFPRLKKLGWTLTVFVNSEVIDRGFSSYMTWDQIRELSSQGVAFENHGHGHIHMIRKQNAESEQAWRLRILNDINTAQRRISEEIGEAPQLFAYPYGEFSPATADIIDELGLVGFGQQSGPVWPGADFSALPRFPMASRYAELESFKLKVNTLPLPIVDVWPKDALVALEQRRPALKLMLVPGAYSKAAIQCYIGGSSDVAISWSEDIPDQMTVKPNFDLKPGRHRTNCTMPSPEKGRFHWYSHNWFVRNPDGSWYAEY